MNRRGTDESEDLSGRLTGNDQAETPNIDALAAEGLRFTQLYFNLADREGNDHAASNH